MTGIEATGEAVTSKERQAWQWFVIGFGHGLMIGLVAGALWVQAVS